MRNRWLINLALLILLVLLGALAQQELEQERIGSSLTGLVPKIIEDIMIQRPGEPAIHLLKTPQGWRMESPYQLPAEPNRIGELAHIAETPVSRSWPQGEDAERLGIGADSLRLTLNGHLLQFGDVDPISGQRYVASGGQLHLIGDGFQHHLMADAEDYVDQSLLPGDFQPSAGSIGDEALSADELAEISGMSAESVEPLGPELTGRLLSLTSGDGQQSLRFLVSPDGLSWARLDQRLLYLVATPPAWAIDDPAADPQPPEAPQAPSGDSGS